MGDHKIYIYSQGNVMSLGGDENGSSPFTPFAMAGEGGGSNQGVATFQKGIQQAQGFVQSGFKGLINTGVAALGRVFPWAVLVYMAIKTADSIITSGLEHISQYTGDYKYNLNFNNWKTTVSNAINPIGMFISAQTRYMQMQKNNFALQEQRTLVGRTLSNRKAGS